MPILTESQLVIVCDTCGGSNVNSGQGRAYSIKVFRKDGWAINGKKATCPQCRKEHRANDKPRD